MKPDGNAHRTIVNGPSGASARIPIQPCDPLDGDGLAKNERVELVFASLDDLVDARVVDGEGRELGHVEVGTLPSGGTGKGVRFKPECGEDHFLEVFLRPGFGGSDTFTFVPRVIVATGPDPWTGVDPTIFPQPGSLPDADRDGLFDAIDTCPAVANPENFDHDGDGKGDACDNCPSFANADQLDRGGLGAGSPANGRGDACECGDVNDDGRVTTADAAMMQRALLVPPTTTMTKPYRCDVGGSAGCSTSDLAILRRALLTPPTATITQKCVP